MPLRSLRGNHGAWALTVAAIACGVARVCATDLVSAGVYWPFALLPHYCQLVAPPIWLRQPPCAASEPPLGGMWTSAILLLKMILQARAQAILVTDTVEVGETTGAD
jgi:hypothetical protein